MLLLPFKSPFQAASKFLCSFEVRENNVDQKSERPQASPKLGGCSHVAPYNSFGGRVNALNPQTGHVNVNSLLFMASRSED